VKRTIQIIILLGLILSFSAAALMAQTSPERSQPPLPGAPPSLNLPALQHLKLKNELPVVLMEKHTLPLVQAELILKAGRVQDPPGKAGLANFVAEMLMEGSAGLNALEFSEAIEQLGAELTSNSDLHRTIISLNVPAARMEKAFSLLAGMVVQPAFTVEELERKRKIRLTQLLQARDQPPLLAAIQFNQALYGKGHPYGFVADEEAALKAFTVEDLRRFHAEWCVPGNAILILAGDATATQALPMLENQLGNWKKGNVPSISLPQVPVPASTNILLVDKPGAPQSVIQIGLIGAPRLTPDYFPLVVMNTLLGGTFTSRLNANLREEHGYTYGAGSRFNFQPLPGPFLASSSVQTEVTDKALTEFIKEIKGIHQLTPAGELDKIRNYISLSFPRNNFQTLRDMAGQLRELVNYNLPDDYFNRYIPGIMAVTAVDVQRVAEKYIRMDKLTIVVVGDRQKIEPGIKALNLGPLKVVTVEELLGPAPTF
jgi:zinc protease